jgi:hypothetical protein
MDLNDESTDAYSHLTMEERYLVKPMALTFIFAGGDAMMRTKCFSLDAYGKNGDKLLEWSNAYSYDGHHKWMSSMISFDPWSVMNGADWTLTMQFGRLSDALSILKERLCVMEKVVARCSVCDWHAIRSHVCA